MESVDLEAHYGRGVVIDVCRSCQGLWFDGREALQLAPNGVLHLFRLIHSQRAEGRNPLAAALRCPRCGASLVRTSDRQRTTRFLFERCPRDHGRFMTYFQFLRAKNFIRSLSAAEAAEVRKHIKQIACANCGAPVNIETESACGHCRTAISMLDPNQVRKTVDELRAAETEARAKAADPTLGLRLLLEKQLADRAFAPHEPPSILAELLRRNGSISLVDAGLDVLMTSLD
jgi:Zn-finger nucleic acid-binding protein